MKVRRMLALVGVVGLLVNAAPAAAGGEQENACQNGCKGPYPDGYDGFLVFMATGAIPVTDSFFLDGAFFQQQIMKRTPAQIAANRQAALDYFEDRFGLVDADNHPDLAFFGFYADPRIEYRAYVISGYKVPTEGFEVHDGGWIALVTNPNGTTLGGAFPGRQVPVNTVFSFGDYNIERTKKGGGPKPSPLIIHYKCNHPLVLTFTGGEVFDCDLESDEFGAGLGQGLTTPLIEDGLLRPNGRTVLTFSDEGGY